MNSNTKAAGSCWFSGSVIGANGAPQPLCTHGSMDSRVSTPGRFASTR